MELVAALLDALVHCGVEQGEEGVRHVTVGLKAAFADARADGRADARQVLENVFNAGHTTWYVKNYFTADQPAAGKTGTTQKIVNGRYSSAHHVASFAGFFPVGDPKLAITVIIDEPAARENILKYAASQNYKVDCSDGKEEWTLHIVK